jgi:hypothetical protein
LCFAAAVANRACVGVLIKVSGCGYVSGGWRLAAGHHAMEENWRRWRRDNCTLPSAAGHLRRQSAAKMVLQEIALRTSSSVERREHASGIAPARVRRWARGRGGVCIHHDLERREASEMAPARVRRWVRGRGGVCIHRDLERREHASGWAPVRFHRCIPGIGDSEVVGGYTRAGTLRVVF